jgi:FkbM family methyltransferase
MIDQTDVSPTDRYSHFLIQQGVSLTPTQQTRIKQISDRTNWDEPATAIDFNNIAVMAMVEADAQGDPSLRELYFETALSMLLAPGVSEHPLCDAHWTMLAAITGEMSASNDAFIGLINGLQQQTIPVADRSPGLIYLPPTTTGDRASIWRNLLNAEVEQQALQVFALALQQTQSIFYNVLGQRLLPVIQQIVPDQVPLLLQQGITQLMQGQPEGLILLHRARDRAPERSITAQALYLGYRSIEQWDKAQFWQMAGHATDEWTQLALDSPFTYLPWDGGYQLAVEASFQSIVTSVLIGLGDWFEAELTFWRSQLQPGMRVIDVGANVGVYTFSAAQQVGATGKVLAIEPFSGCVQCLEATCRINTITQVQVCAGAASDQAGMVKLSLNAASELNEICPIETDQPDQPFESVPSFTLDDLIQQASWDRVDFLKIDAEGHELQVLQGATRILSEFRPVILYENLAGSQGSNRPVAEFLQATGYELFRYQPYIGRLIAIDPENLQNSLNLIALPT